MSMVNEEKAAEIMNERRLGVTNISLSEIGLGTWPLGGPVQVGNETIGRGQISESDAIATVEAARDSNIKFFDTADIYGLGQAEKVLGKVFTGHWNETIVASKVGKVVSPKGSLGVCYSGDHIRRSLEGSLRRLRKDCVDIYLLHNPPPEIALKAESIESLAKLQTEGKIRCWGVSARLVKEAITMIKDGFQGAVMEVVFNLLRQEAAMTLFPLARKAGIGILVRVPLEYGVLTGRFTKDTTFPLDDHRHDNLEPRLAAELQRVGAFRFLLPGSQENMALAAIRFCLAYPDVTSVITGAMNASQIRINATASDLGPLPRIDVERAERLFADNFNTMGCVIGDLDT
jgi:aryl-alcohol dehydrogenase-like predicted oxidoreductase